MSRTLPTKTRVYGSFRGIGRGLAVGAACLVVALWAAAPGQAQFEPDCARPAQGRELIARLRLAEIEGYVWSQEYSIQAQLSAALRGGAGAAMLPVLMNKLYSTDTMQRITRLAFDLLGADGLVAALPEEYVQGARVNTPGRWVAQYMFAIANSIAGGASNIQRNIIAERGLGLPRDPRAV